jgi:hypothetical protein
MRSRDWDNARLKLTRESSPDCICAAAFSADLGWQPGWAYDLRSQPIAESVCNHVFSSTMKRWPCSSTVPMSPVANQPSTKAVFVASGRLE